MKIDKLLIACILLVGILVSHPVLAFNLKEGVDVSDLKQPITDILLVLDEIHYDTAKRDAIITGAVENRSLETSLHPVGLAIDLRTRDLSKKSVRKLVSEIKKELDGCYDVIRDHDHIHIEFDSDNWQCNNEEPSYVKYMNTDLQNINTLIEDSKDVLRTTYDGRWLVDWIYRAIGTAEDGTSKDGVRTSQSTTLNEYGSTRTDSGYHERARAFSIRKGHDSTNYSFQCSSVAEIGRNILGYACHIRIHTKH